MSLYSKHFGFKQKSILILFGVLFFCTLAQAQLTITIHSTDKDNGNLGTIIAQDTRYGVLLTPNLTGLPPGLHGFHLHTLPNCEEGGIAAGGHFDPHNTQKHLGPYQRGHLGDLPPLWVDANDNASLPVLAPRLREKDLLQHALVIHQGGDNYKDQPEPLGGGGKRIACGIVN